MFFSLLNVSSAHAVNIFNGSGSPCSTNPKADVCESSTDAANANNKSNALLGSGGLLTTLINVFIYADAIISVIVIMLAGIRYATSGGDSGAISSAKNTIIYGLVGLAIAVFAGSIVFFVLGYL
jgi:hypothetical protein